MSTDAKTIRADRFAEIGSIIQRDAGLIVDRWARRAVDEQPQAERVHQEVLRDHLPNFLVDVGRGLKEAGDPDNCPHYAQAAAHGEQRWQTGWSLHELIRDYQILRLVVLDYLDEVLDRPLQLREVLAVGLALDEAITASVVRFVQFCDEHVQIQTEALRDANRRKNEFMATLAHELRNPLAPLRNAVDVLRLRGSDPGIVAQLQDVLERQVQQMTRLVDDLLDMSRIEMGKLTLRKEHVDLKGVLVQAVQSIAHLAQARRQELTPSLPPGNIWIAGDQARLTQVFVNLLHNAVKYTPDQGQIELGAELTADDVVVRIRDTGVGIPSEMLGKIFDLFTQIDLGTGREQGGLGIGLALVRRLVELHEGTIAVQSSGANAGSEFSVTLPLAGVEPAMCGPDTAVAAVAARFRILLVEDHPDGRNSLLLLLKLVGHDVVAAEDGTRGLEVARQSPPQVALIDIGLPDIDGYEVARRIRHELGQSMLLVALTGYSQPEDRQRARDAGFNAHLVKPVDLQTLQALLATHFQKGGVSEDYPERSGLVTGQPF